MRIIEIKKDMARIRFIKKNAEGIVEDCFKELETTLDSSNLPAYIILNEVSDKKVLNLSYTGSTESISETVHGGVDVSIGSRSGRIIKVEGTDIFRHIDDILTIDTPTDRAKNNLRGGVELIKELE